MADYPDMICLHQSFDPHCIVYYYTQYTYTRTIMQIVSCIIAYNILSSMIYSAGAAIVTEIFNTVRHAQATHSWRPCMAFAVPERADCKTAETAVRSQLSPWLKRLRLDRKLVQCSA